MQREFQIWKDSNGLQLFEYEYIAIFGKKSLKFCGKWNIYMYIHIPLSLSRECFGYASDRDPLILLQLDFPLPFENTTNQGFGNVSRNGFFDN